MKISGCIIARNEEENIGNCINNLKCVTDEIIVVDTGSDDNTVQIATELGATIYEYKWENDFSKAKNAALDLAEGDWIIFLDADEYFHEDSLCKVPTVIANAHSNRSIEGIFSEIVHIDIEDKQIISNDEILRIFRNNKQFRFINKIHEEIRNNGMALNCINARNILKIMHTGYSASLQVNKAKRNLELMLSNTEDEKSAYYFAITYFILQDFDNAYKYADLALTENAITGNDTLSYKMYLIKINITINFEFSNKAKIRSLINEVNHKYGNHPEIAKIEAIYLLMEKYYEKALEKYMYALNCQEKYGNTFVQNNFMGSIHEVYYSIAQILYLMNKEADALDFYVKAIQSSKYNKNVFNGMFALCRTMPESEIIAFINSIYDVANEDDVKFVIAQIADCGRPKIVLYYASKWNCIFAHEDDILIYAFISQGNYPNALEIALLYLETDKDTYAPLVTSILIMGELFSDAEKVKADIGEDYFNLIVCYAENRKYTESKDAYRAVFSKLIKYIDQFDIANYLKMGTELGENSIWEIGEIIEANFHFEQAIGYFGMLFEFQIDDDLRANAAFETGYCFYKLKQYPESAYWFEKAMENGYVENDMAEYLKWITDQSSDHDIKRKAEALTASFYTLVKI